MPNPIRWRALRALGGILASFLLLAACAGPETQGGKESDHLMIVEVYGAGFAAGGADQFIRLYNPNRAPIELAGWSLGDGKARALFPRGARIGPGQTFYAARSAAGFAQVMGFPPDAIWGDGPAEGPLRMSGAAGLVLSREAGMAVLRDPTGRPVDQVVWGHHPDRATVGWKGNGVPTPQPGEVLDRARDESGWSGRAPGDYLADSDTAQDWHQGRDWVDRRVLRPGQTVFPYPTFTVRSLTAYASPDSSFEVLAGLVDGARQQIDLNVYSFSNLVVADKLAAAARRGVQVRLLLEASSLGALDDQERYAARIVHEAGGQVRWIMNQPGAGVYGRYVFNHAKYGVIDGRSVFVQSENLGFTGTPVDPTAGNRGWGVAIRDQALAGYLSRVFQADWNPNHGDTFPYKEGTPFGPPSPGFLPEAEIPIGAYAHPFPPLTLTDPVQVTPVLAPDHALMESKGITGLIRSARRSVLVEQLYI